MLCAFDRASQPLGVLFCCGFSKEDAGVCAFKEKLFYEDTSTTLQFEGNHDEVAISTYRPFQSTSAICANASINACVPSLAWPWAWTAR